jgi:hypothetical protein
MAQFAFGIVDHPLPVIPRPVVQPVNKTVAAPHNKPVLQEATAVHSIAVAIPFAADARFVIAAWIGFAGDREAAVSIVMVGFVNAMLFGFLAGGGWYSRNMTPERATDRSFAASQLSLAVASTSQPVASPPARHFCKSRPCPWFWQLAARSLSQSRCGVGG